MSLESVMNEFLWKPLLRGLKGGWLVVSKRLIEAHIWLIVNLVETTVKYSYTHNLVVGIHNTVTYI